MDLAKWDLTPKFPEVLDSSMLGDFVKCPSYFYLRHVLGLRRKAYDKVEDSGADWGTVWHRMNKALHDAITDGADFAEASEHGLLALDPWPDSIRAETDRHNRSRERMAAIWIEYVSQYAIQDVKEFDFIDVEQFFDIYDEEFEIRWCGRVDRVARRKRNGKLFIWDYKTTSYLTQFFFEKYQHGFQLPGYVRMFSQILTEPVHEAFLDVLHTLKSDHKFYRRTFPYSEGALAEWASNVRGILDHMYWLRDHHLHNPEAWTKRWDRCTDYNRLCQFADVHFLDPRPGTRMRILQNSYIEDRWDPSFVED